MAGAMATASSVSSATEKHALLGNDMEAYNKITEATTTILYPKSDAEAFYNPVQEFNRDLTIAVINQWSALFLEERRAKYAKQVAPKKPLLDVQRLFYLLCATSR